MMYYIFNQKGKCICSCNYEPDIEDLAIRNEVAVQDDNEYDTTKIQLVDNVIVQLMPSLDELKALKLREIDAWTAAKITGGFYGYAGGETVWYDSDKDTQLTMQGIALNVNTPLFAEKYPNGCPVRGVKEGDTEKTVQYLSAKEVLSWCAVLSIHIGVSKQLGWQKQAQVAAATTPEELNAITLR